MSDKQSETSWLLTPGNSDTTQLMLGVLTHIFKLAAKRANLLSFNKL